MILHRHEVDDEKKREATGFCPNPLSPGEQVRSTRFMESAEMKNQLQKICKIHHIEIVYVFGSRSREIKQRVDEKRSRPTKRFPDVDIGIKMTGKARLSVRDKVQVMRSLEDLFEVGRVDLVVLGEADPFLAANVIRGERLFCEDDQRADNYDLYILRRAGDLAPLEREREKLIFGEIS